jgi:hypothetical protein
MAINGLNSKNTLLSISTSDPEFGCGNVGCNPCNDNILISIDEQIALKNIGTTEYNDETEWEATKYLFEKLKKYPYLQSGNALYENFFSNYENSNIDKITEIKFDEKQLNELPAVQLNQYTNNENVIEANLTNIASLNESIYSESDATIRASLQSQIDYLQNQNNSLITANNGILNSFMLLKSTGSDLLKSDNSNINTSKDIEENIKLVNEIYLSTIAKGNFNFSEQQRSTLLSVAVQCPYAGGPGVYQARSIYHIVEPSRIYNDIENCFNLGYYRKSHPEVKENRKFLIFPNPASDHAQLLYVLPQDRRAKCIVYDVNGSQVLLIDLAPNSAETSIDIKGLISNIYHFVIYIDGEVVGDGTFSIAK